MSARLIVADVLDGLALLDDGCARCVVTSPPYWGLRDYGVAGQIGLEATPAEYVARMVDVFRAVRRVLAKDGTLWLNLGDCYATGAGKVGDSPGGGEQGERWKERGPGTQANRMPQAGLKPKDLVGMPWRVAFALQDDGWWLRSDVIWEKPNPMPESVTDRPTRSHEYLFLLARSARYFYDAAAIAEPVAEGTAERLERAHSGYAAPGQTAHNGTAGPRPNRRQRSPEGRSASPQIEEDPAAFSGTRNRRTVWRIPTQGFAEAHFATFPEDLVEPCILAGSARGDIVLDPFAGSGTVGLVADRLGRDFIGVELNPAYAAMAERRLTGDSPLFSEVSLTPKETE